MSGQLAPSDHQPVLPVWTCQACNRPWPCRTRRRELLAEFDGVPISLTFYMGNYLVWASADLASHPAGLLYLRFVGWIA